MKQCSKMVRYEFVGPLQCGKGFGHLSECQVPRSTIDVARLWRLSRYQAALQQIASFGIGDCVEIAVEALEPTA